MATSPLKNRVLWIDVVRIVAIYFVVVIHNFASQKPVPAWDNIVVLTIISTSVPLFVMISGTLLLDKKESYTLFFSKRVNKVVIPWIFWTCIYMSWYFFVNHMRISSVLQPKFFFQVAFSLWFLPMILGLYFLTPMFRLFVQGSTLKHIFYSIIIWYLVISVLPFFHNSLAFPQSNNSLVIQVINYSGYFLLGFFLIKINMPKHILLLSLLFIFLSILCTEFLSFHLWARPSDRFNSVYLNFISPNIVITSVALFILIRESIHRVTDVIHHYVSSGIVAVSSASFGIYLIHPLVMWTVGPYVQGANIFFYRLNPTLVGVIMGIFFFLLSFIIVYLLQRIRFIRNIVP